MERASKRVKHDSVSGNDNQVDDDDKEAEKQELPPVALNYDELRTIFKFMNTIDVLRTARVCKSWKAAAYDEVDSRLSPECIFRQFTSIKKGKPDVSNCRAYTPGSDLHVKPYLGFVFMRLNTHAKVDEGWSPTECFCHHLPPRCEPLAILTGHNIIANDKYPERGENWAVATFLPKIPNLTIQTHTVPLIDEDILDMNKEEDLLKKFFKDNVWNCNQKSKCVILLTTGDIYELPKFITKHFQSMYEPGTIAMWGGISVNLNNCPSKHDDSPSCLTPIMCRVISISSPSLQSWSIILPESCKSMKKMEKRLRKFKENIQLKKNSLALMCACVARESNVPTEIKTFKSIFPEILLVGFLGDGEYGLDTLNKGRAKELQLSYCTVFLILTYE